MIFCDPFDFAAYLMELDLETLNDIFPECGSLLNIFKYYTYEQAIDRYNKWQDK